MSTHAAGKRGQFIDEILPVAGNPGSPDETPAVAVRLPGSCHRAAVHGFHRAIRWHCGRFRSWPMLRTPLARLQELSRYALPPDCRRARQRAKERCPARLALPVPRQARTCATESGLTLVRQRCRISMDGRSRQRCPRALPIWRALRRVVEMARPAWPVQERQPNPSAHGGHDSAPHVVLTELPAAGPVPPADRLVVAPAAKPE